MRRKPQDYILANPNDPVDEHNACLMVNQNGGPTRYGRRMAIEATILTAFIMTVFLVPVAVVRLFALLAFVMLLAGFLYWHQHAMMPLLRRKWVVTDNPELIALDKAWRDSILTETDPMWHGVWDEARFLRVRDLARMEPAEAAPLIAAERSKLRPNNSAADA